MQQQRCTIFCDLPEGTPAADVRDSNDLQYCEMFEVQAKQEKSEKPQPSVTDHMTRKVSKSGAMRLQGFFLPVNLTYRN